METRKGQPMGTDAKALADKLAAFDATLTPAERVIFRRRIAATLFGDEDVEAHAMEAR